MKYTLHLKDYNNPVELDAEDIFANDVRMPWEASYGVRLYVIGHEFGPIAALWASCEQDAFDELIDKDKGSSFLVDEGDMEDYK